MIADPHTTRRNQGGRWFVSVAAQDNSDAEPAIIDRLQSGAPRCTRMTVAISSCPQPPTWPRNAVDISRGPTAMDVSRPAPIGYVADGGVEHYRQRIIGYSLRALRRFGGVRLACRGGDIECPCRCRSTSLGVHGKRCRSSHDLTVSVVQVAIPVPRKSLSLVQMPALSASALATTGQSAGSRNDRASASASSGE